MVTYSTLYGALSVCRLCVKDRVDGSLIRFSYEAGEPVKCPEGDRRITSQPSGLQAVARPELRGGQRAADNTVL